MRHSLSTALPRIFNSVDLAPQSSRRSRGSLTTFLFYHVCLHSSRFCGRFFSVFAVLFHASRLLLFCSGPFSAASPFLPKKHPARRCLRELSQKGNFWKFPVFHAGNTPIHAEKSCVYPPPRAIFSLAGNLCFLVPQSMLWYELEGTVAHRPVRFQYIIEYM